MHLLESLLQYRQSLCQDASNDSVVSIVNVNNRPAQVTFRNQNIAEGRRSHFTGCADKLVVNGRHINLLFGLRARDVPEQNKSRTVEDMIAKALPAGITL